MNFKKAIIFDIYGEFGHFRKFNTTTSPLTFSLPTPSAVFGMLGAILGIEREDSQNTVNEDENHLRKVFSAENAYIAIRPISRIKKVNMAFNLLITSSSPNTFYNIKPSGRSQIEFELLKNPRFRIYLCWNHLLRNNLIERLEDKNFYFNPYLGLAQMTANIDYIGEKKLNKIIKEDYVDFCSAINLSEIDSDNPIDIDYMKSRVFQLETFPLEMNVDRTISRYGEVLTEMNGFNVKAVPNDKSFSIIDEGNVQFL
ncbi:type I-B CRISPR-associated protein Cas5b [Psychroflexus planctonicus]|uniref:Type I-B CRISPR-associated protein Cas5 n=1 Tax=Psychroflexus planctonicus TaxID=1526575 RepID=A0ABQ1SDA4_9FLAO|nr:type I-B CRISPR-associated protein Cas5b [Psychroflexus planctonicus]GGE27262.1 hypothetical protein GCM10010832_04990 [Psychroflexus planctonicus]